MLLIYPPGARSTEAPVGLSRLAGYLHDQGRPSTILDLGQEGVDYLLGKDLEAPPEDTWTGLALRRRARHTALLRSPQGADNFGAYSRAIFDLGRALKAASPPGVDAGLADYREDGRSPLRRADLLAAARDWEASVFRDLYVERLEALVPGTGDGLVGISLTYLSQALPAFALLGAFRARYPRVRLILGGGLVTSWLGTGLLGPEDRFEGFVDGLVAGRGEEGLAPHLGLSPSRGFHQPRFDGLDRASYLSPRPILPWNFTTGCPWKRCAFCPELAEDQPYRGSPGEAAALSLRAEVEAWASAGQPPGLIHLSDSEVAPLYLRSLAAHPPGAPWYGFARFTPLLADRAFCRSLAASGCVMLQLGLESGDQGVLDAMGKGTTLGLYDEVLTSLAEAGIGVYAYLLFGTPEEDREAALRTRDFVAQRADRLAFLNLAIFNMPATSPEARLYGQGTFYTGDYSLYCEFDHPKGWNRPEIRRFLSRDFEGDPALKALVQRTPPVYTSNHAPFFLLAGLRS